MNTADDTEHTQTREGGPSDETRRERSTIEFPYMDLGMALVVAKAVFARNGMLGCQHDQLANGLSLSSKSSGYRTRISTAKIFGLISSDRGSDEVKLTELGARAIDQTKARKAKADAFLEVDLYRELYDQHRGQQFPPTAALHRELESLGVASKQVERARQVMERSAEAAGFFEGGRDRLIMPTKLGHEDGDDGKLDGDGDGGNGGDGDDWKQPPVDPIITGLLARLPKVGAVWPEAERALWLELLKGSFKLIYKDKEQKNAISPETALD